MENVERTATAITTVPAIVTVKTSNATYITTASIVMLGNQFFSSNKLYFMHSHSENNRRVSSEIFGLKKQSSKLSFTNRKKNTQKKRMHYAINLSVN